MGNSMNTVAATSDNSGHTAALKFTPPRTHVSNKDIGGIKSPLDSLFKKENGGGAKG